METVALQRVPNPIRRLSLFVMWVCYIIILVSAVSTAAVLHWAATQAIWPPVRPEGAFSIISRPLILVFWILAPLGKALCLYHLARLFHGFSHGDIFTKSSIRRIKWISYSLGIYAIIVASAISARMTLKETTPYGWTQNLSTAASVLMLGLVIWIIAWIFEKGRSLQEESTLTV